MATSTLNSTLSTEAPPVIRFLAASEEAFMIGLPIFGAILTIALWILGRFGLAWNLGASVGFICGLIFMDGVHVIFSFVLLYSLPELRGWAKSKETVAKSGWMRGLGPNLRSVVIALALGSVFYFLKICPATYTLRGMATTFLFLELLGPAQHTVAQMRGISLCYNSSIRRNCKLTEAELKQAALCEKVERILFQTLLLSEVLYWLPPIFNFDQFKVPLIDSIQFVGGVAAIASATGILVNALYYPRHELSKKWAFLLRVTLYPLKMLTIVGTLTMRAAHGTEYLMIYRRMVQGSKINKQKRKQIYLLTFIFSALYGFMTIPVAIQVAGFSSPTGLFAAILIATFVIRFTHYYLDSIIFRMSDPATRGVVGPLLTVAPPASAEESWFVPGLKFLVPMKSETEKQKETV